MAANVLLLADLALMHLFRSDHLQVQNVLLNDALRFFKVLLLFCFMCKLAN